MGLCLDEPYEPVWNYSTKKKHADQGLIEQVKRIAPGVGKRAAEFGAFAVDNPDVLRSYDGVVLLQSAYEEQEFRIEAWSSRHEALMEAFPQTEPSEQILLHRLSLDEMLKLQNALVA
jgi:hypothetical protein